MATISSQPQCVIEYTVCMGAWANNNQEASGCHWNCYMMVIPHGSPVHNTSQSNKVFVFLFIADPQSAEADNWISAVSALGTWLEKLSILMRI